MKHGHNHKQGGRPANRQVEETMRAKAQHEAEMARTQSSNPDEKGVQPKRFNKREKLQV